MIISHVRGEFHSKDSFAGARFRPGISPTFQHVGSIIVFGQSAHSDGDPEEIGELGSNLRKS
jgi:hypothetical protein